MTKEDMLRRLLESNQEVAIYELLRQANNAGEIDDSSAAFPDSRFVRLIGAVRNHLIFLIRFGKKKSHVEDESGCHYFAYPEKLEEWLKLDAPGLVYADVKNLYSQKNQSD